MIVYTHTPVRIAFNEWGTAFVECYECGQWVKGSNLSWHFEHYHNTALKTVMNQAKIKKGERKVKW